MLRGYTYGLELLQRTLVRYLRVDEDRLFEYFFYYVWEAFQGNLGLEEAYEKVEVNTTHRVPLIAPLMEFDQGVTENTELLAPDITGIGEDEEALLLDAVGLSRRAWERLRDTDSYMEGIFMLSVLVGVFLSSYSEEEVRKVNVRPLYRAFGPLGTAFSAKELEHEYGKGNTGHL